MNTNVSRLGEFYRSLLITHGTYAAKCEPHQRATMGSFAALSSTIVPRLTGNFMLGRNDSHGVLRKVQLRPRVCHTRHTTEHPQGT